MERQNQRMQVQTFAPILGGTGSKSNQGVKGCANAVKLVAFCFVIAAVTFPGCAFKTSHDPSKGAAPASSPEVIPQQIEPKTPSIGLVSITEGKSEKTFSAPLYARNRIIGTDDPLVMPWESLTDSHIKVAIDPSLVDLESQFRATIFVQDNSEASKPQEISTQNLNFGVTDKGRVSIEFDSNQILSRFNQASEHSVFLLIDVFPKEGSNRAASIRAEIRNPPNNVDVSFLKNQTLEGNLSAEELRLLSDFTGNIAANMDLQTDRLTTVKVTNKSNRAVRVVFPKQTGKLTEFVVSYSVTSDCRQDEVESRSTRTLSSRLYLVPIDDELLSDFKKNMIVGISGKDMFRRLQPEESKLYALMAIGKDLNSRTPSQSYQGTVQACYPHCSAWAMSPIIWRNALYTDSCHRCDQGERQMCRECQDFEAAHPEKGRVCSSWSQSTFSKAVRSGADRVYVVSFDPIGLQVRLGFASELQQPIVERTKVLEAGNISID